MLSSERITHSKSPSAKLTTLEQGLKNAIFDEDMTKKAFQRLVKCGYDANHLIIHLTLWARSPEVLFSKSARSELPTRDGRRTLEKFSLRLRTIADELVGQSFCKKVLDPKFLEPNHIIQQNGGLEMARCIQLLPETLRVYSRLLTHTLLIKNRFARNENTLNENRAEFTRIFVDLVKGTTGKDRIDSVVTLFNSASKHFGLGEHFEKRALTAQLKRLREKIQTKSNLRNSRSMIH